MGDWNVKIKDFQSLKSVDIDIKSGITIITGPTNNGKTAILRAIENSLFNSMTDDMVRSGKKVAGVTISNGTHNMVYMRNAHGKNEKTAYQFDGGNVQKKVGRSQLPEVIDMFGVTDVKMNNGVKVRLNFWEQNDKPFLMDKTAGQLFEFLTLSSADRYFKILKTMAADIKVQEAEINNSNTVIDTLKSINNTKQEFLDRNQGFNNVYADVINLGSRSDSYNRNTNTLEELSKINDRINNISNTLKQVKNKIKSIPVNKLKSQVEDLLLIQGNYDRSYSQAVKLAGTKKDISSVSNLLTLSVDKYDKLSKLLDSNKGCIERINFLANNINLISDKISKCESIKSKIDLVNNKLQSIKIPNIDYSKIESNITYIKSTQSRLDDNNKNLKLLSNIKDSIGSLTSDMQGVDLKIKKNQESLDKLKKSVGYCPFCGSVFNK